MRTILLALACLGCCGTALADETDEAQFKAGDMVVPTKVVEIKLDNKVVDYVTAGWCVRVLKVKGDRLWVSAGNAGWLNAADVLPLEKGVEYFSKALRDDPKNADLYGARGNVRVQLKQFDKAIDDFTKGLKLSPDDISLRTSRATCYLAQKEYDKAIEDHTAVLRLDPSQISYNNRGYANLIAGKWGDALADLEAAEVDDETRLMPAANLAYLRACCPDAQYRDGRQAVALATRACEGDKYLDSDDLHILACAHAEAGNFAKAAKWEAKSIELHPADKPKSRKIKERALEEFKAQRPFHEISALED